MIKRIKTLVMLQLGDKFKKSKRQTEKIVFGFAGFIFLASIWFSLIYIMAKVVYLPVSEAMILFIILITQILTIVASAGTLTKSLFNSRDNALLLAFPTYHNEVYISKLIVFYIDELFKNLIFLLPLLLAYGLYSYEGIWYFFAILLLTIILPIISVLIGALLSLPLLIFEKLLKKYSFLYLLIITLVIVFLFKFFSNLIKLLPKPFRLVALYNIVISKVITFIDNANEFALFYRWCADFLFQDQIIINFLWIILLIIGLLIANFLLSKPLFFRLASRTAEDSVQKNHKGINKPSRSTFIAFFKKEIILSVRNLGQVLSNYLIVMILPLVIYLINSVFRVINLNAFGQILVFGFNIIIGLLMITAGNTNSATALSIEGSEFVLLKTSPADTQKIAWAKIALNIIYSSILLIISALVLNSLHIMKTSELLTMALVYFFVNIGHIMWTFQLDLRNPQLRDVAYTGHIINYANVSKSLTNGITIAIIFGFLGALFYYSSPGFGMVMIIAFSIVFALWRFLVFRINLQVHFYEIEF